MRPTSSSNNRATLSYLLTFGMVAFTRYSIYPWLLLHIQARKYESWAQAVVSYGALLTCLNLGISLGQTISSYSKQLSNSFFMAALVSLASSYISLVFVTRFAVMSMMMFSIGFSGALLSDFSLSLDKGTPSLTFHRKNSEIDPNSNLERGVVCFVFATLMGSLLYDPRAFVNYPAFYLAVLLGVALLVMVVYYLVLASAIVQKTNKVKVIGGRSTGGTGGGSGAASAGDMTSLSAEVDAGAEYEGDVPLNFLSACRGDLQKARKMYGKMLAWRKRFDVDHIFQHPQRIFNEILEYYPHGIHGYSLDGCGVVYEVLGRGNPKGLEKTGITIDELVWHFNIRNELVLHKLCSPAALEEAVRKNPPGAITITPFPYETSAPGVLRQPVPRLMTVIDVHGISITSVTTQVISFIKKSGEIIDNYYPEQVARLVVCRAPRWFSTIWTVIARVLPEAVQKKVDILYDAKGLDKYIHPSQRPKEYGGTDVDLGEWEGHKMFQQIAEAWKTMRPSPGAAASTSPLTIQTDGLAAETSGGAADAARLSRKSSFLSSGSLATAAGGGGGSAVSPKGGESGAKGGDGAAKSGVVGWLVNRFGSGGSKPTTAYLGEKNSYRYNAATGMWEMDVDIAAAHEGGADGRDRSGKTPSASSGGAGGVGGGALESDDEADDGAAQASDAVGGGSSRHSPRATGGRSRKRGRAHMTQEQIEEHGLVLAIQAAHYASQYAAQQRSAAQYPGQSSGGGGGGGGGAGGGLSMSASFANLELGLPSPSVYGRGGLEREYSGSGRAFEAAATFESSAATGALSGGETSAMAKGGAGGAALTKLSSSIFLIVVVVFVLTTSMQMMMVTLLPVWLCAPLRSGGLGYNVRDLGLQLSCSGLVVLHAHLFFGRQFDHVLRASPVRALRIGAGWMCLALLLLPLYARWFTVPLEDVLHHSSSHESSHFGLDETEQRTTSLWRWHHHHMQSVLQQSETDVLSSLQGLSPSTSLCSLLLCAVFIATLICTSHLCRKASGMLLHLVLSAVFQNPASIRQALYTLADMLGPLLSCVAYSVVYSSHIRFPLNSSFFFPFSASLAVLSYMLSLFLVVHFRGDYGVMSDYQDWRAMARQCSLAACGGALCGGGGVGVGGGGAGGALGAASTPSKKAAAASSPAAAAAAVAGKSSARSSGGHGLSQRGGGSGGGHGDVTRSRSWSLDGSGAGDAAGALQLHEHQNHQSQFHVLAIPLGDMQLLFSTVGHGYGSKLYNLKDDFKDV